VTEQVHGGGRHVVTQYGSAGNEFEAEYDDTQIQVDVCVDR
jgi:hypothetical protein